MSIYASQTMEIKGRVYGGGSGKGEEVYEGAGEREGSYINL
jgi:hypothetical protein